MSTLLLIDDLSAAWPGRCWCWRRRPDAVAAWRWRRRWLTLGMAARSGRRVSRRHGAVRRDRRRLARPDRARRSTSASASRLDGLSLWLFGLTALLMVVAVLVSWEAIDEQASLYYRCCCCWRPGMLGVFVARDIILFYVFFEFTLIPLFFLIGIWGSEERRYAAVKFFLFTLAGSVLTFLGLLAIVLWDYYHPTATDARQMTFSIPELTDAPARAADGRRRVQLVDLPGAVRRLRDQGAAVPAAHLAAAGPRRRPRRPAA